MNRNTVFEAISSERDYQDRKWGTIDKHPHEVGGYLTIMRNILAQADAAWSAAAGDYGSLEEIRKLAATAVACMEQHGTTFRSHHCDATGGRVPRSRDELT